jgi:hypothetical protein
MKIYSMLFAAIVVGLAGTSAQAADSKLRIVKSLPLGSNAQVESVPGVNAVTPFYSNVTTFLGTGLTFGGTAAGQAQPGGGTGLLTSMACDDLSLSPGNPNGSYTLNELKFSLANFNTAAVSAAPTVLFYLPDGTAGGPGTVIDGVAFNPVSIGAGSVSILTANLSTLSPQISFALDANGDATVWACTMLDDDGGSTGATLAQMDDLGAGLCNPPTVGSSADNLFVSNAPVLPPYANPAGSQGNFGGNPVANLCYELSQ